MSIRGRRTRAGDQDCSAQHRDQKNEALSLFNTPTTGNGPIHES